MNFFKRFLSLILTFILIFSISVPCYASDSNSDKSDPAGWDSWSFDEKYDFVLKQGMNLLCGFTGIVHGDVSAIEEILLDFYASRPESGVSNFYEYLANGLSFDDSSQMWMLSDELVNFLNQVIVEYNDRVTMQYRYPVNVNNLTADNFPNKALYQGMVDLSNAFPNCYFYFYSYSGVGNPDSFKGKGYREQNGSWGAHFPYSSDADGFYLVGCVESPFACTTNYMDIFSSPVTFYDDGWSASNSTTRLFLIRPYSSTDYDLWYQDSFYSDYMLVRINDLSSLNLNDIPFIRNTPSLPLYLSSQYKTGYSFNVPISSSTEALNCYKSVADMKKDIGSQTVGTYHPNYTGTTHNYISQTEINNYYPPAPDDPSPVPGDTVDYTEYLQFICNEIQKINTSISELDTSCDHSVIEGYLVAQNSRLDDLYYLLNNIYLLCQVPDQSDNSDILDALNALTDKLVNIQHSLDNPDYSDITDRLDDMEETVSDMKDLLDDQNETLDDIKDIVNGISDNMFDFSNMDQNINEINIVVQKISSDLDTGLIKDMNKAFKDIKKLLEELNNNLVALAHVLVGKDAFDQSLFNNKWHLPDDDDIMLAAYDELNNLLPENDTSIGGALGDIFKQLLDFQTPIDDLVQDEEYIDEIEDLLKQLLPKDPEKNDDDSLFDKLLKNIELSLQLYANSVDEVKETSKTKFPFSIGYDIELLLLVLSAEPQTPVFNIPFEYARLNYKTNIIVDFSMFDDAIDVIRFFLTIYYIFFLLMITPKMVGLNNEVDS